jgi:hypothetical protein
VRKVFLLPKNGENDTLVIKPMEIMNAPLLRPLGVAILIAAAAATAAAADVTLQKVPALTIQQAPLYPQNLARIDLGAQAEVTPQNDQIISLISGDPKAACTLSAGTHTILIALGRIEHVESLGFINADAKGSVTIAMSNARLDAGSPQWRDAGKRDLSNGVLMTKIGPAEAKYVRLTFNLIEPGRLSDLGVYGASGVADFTAPRPRRAIEIAQVNYNLTDLHTKARALYVSSGADTKLANRMIDDQPATAYSFAINDNAPATIIDLGREMALHRISVLSSAGAGTANFYVLTSLPVDAANAPETLRIDDATLAGMKSVGRANDDGAGRTEVDFPETSGRYVLVKWSGTNPNFSVAEIATFGRAPANMLFAANHAVDPKGDGKDGKDAKDFKDIPAEGPPAPAEGPALGLPSQPPFVFIPQIVPTSP